MHDDEMRDPLAALLGQFLQARAEHDITRAPVATVTRVLRYVRYTVEWLSQELDTAIVRAVACDDADALEGLELLLAQVEQLEELVADPADGSRAAADRNAAE